MALEKILKNVNDKFYEYTKKNPEWYFYLPSAAFAVVALEIITLKPYAWPVAILPTLGSLGFLGFGLIEEYRREQWEEYEKLNRKYEELKSVIENDK